LAQRAPQQVLALPAAIRWYRPAMRMAMKKRRMRGGRRQATYAKLCRVAKLHPGRRG